MLRMVTFACTVKLVMVRVPTPFPVAVTLPPQVEGFTAVSVGLPVPEQPVNVAELMLSGLPLAGALPVIVDPVQVVAPSRAVLIEMLLISVGGRAQRGEGEGRWPR